MITHDEFACWLYSGYDRFYHINYLYTIILITDVLYLLLGAIFLIKVGQIFNKMY